jgi:hypothetical protein
MKNILIVICSCFILISCGGNVTKSSRYNTTSKINYKRCPDGQKLIQRDLQGIIFDVCVSIEKEKHRTSSTELRYMERRKAELVAQEKEWRKEEAEASALREKRIKEKEKRIKEELKKNIKNIISSKPDKVQPIILKIRKIHNLRKNDFEKTSDFEKRKQKMISKLTFPTDKLFSSETIPKSVKYDPDNEFWLIQIGEYKKGYPLLDEDMIDRYDHLKIITEQVADVKKKYVGQNVMGWKKVITSHYDEHYGLLVISTSSLRSISDYMVTPNKPYIPEGYKEFQIKVNMPINEAKRYGKKPKFKYRLVYKINGNVVDKNVIEYSSYDGTGMATLDKPYDISWKTGYLNVKLYALAVYIEKKNKRSVIQCFLF